jgi:hypothetical protein
MSAIRTVMATRYVAPLRQGGSLPAIVEADDDGLYVVKFRGAGQGPRTLIAELVAGELARTLGLLVPEIVFVDLDPALGRSEPDHEIQALLKASAGLNLGLDYLPGALDYTPLLPPPPPPELAAAVVWFDAYITNVDRTVRNPNMLLWHKEIWLIDHGAALYFHYDWQEPLARSRDPFPRIREHPLLPFVTAASLQAAGARLRHGLTDGLLGHVTALIPEDWLDVPAFATPEAHRNAYAEYLAARRDDAASFTETVLDALTNLDGARTHTTRL